MVGDSAEEQANSGMCKTASPDRISMLVHWPRARHPRHYSLTQQWCAQWLAVSRGEPQSTPRLHKFPATHMPSAPCTGANRTRVHLRVRRRVKCGSSSCSQVVRSAIRCSAAEQHEEHACIACMLPRCCLTELGGDATAALQPHIKQRVRALRVSAHAASYGDTTSSWKRFRTPAMK